MRPESPTGLYWSIRGEIGCSDDAPEASDPRWTDERWKPCIPALPSRHPTYACKHCNGGTPIVHGRLNAADDHSPR